MVGGQDKAYSIVGVEEGKVLIVDPHYIGEDKREKIKDKGCYWKSSDMFKKEYFYNFCLPLRK